MKLLDEEIAIIQACMTDHQLDKDHVLTKKKGWVRITLPHGEFSFHRKKESKIINGKFTDQISYAIRIGEYHQSDLTFAEFETYLNQWIKDAK